MGILSTTNIGRRATIIKIREKIQTKQEVLSSAYKYYKITREYFLDFASNIEAGDFKEEIQVKRIKREEQDPFILERIAYNILQQKNLMTPIQDSVNKLQSWEEQLTIDELVEHFQECHKDPVLLLFSELGIDGKRIVEISNDCIRGLDKNFIKGGKEYLTEHSFPEEMQGLEKYSTSRNLLIEENLKNLDEGHKRCDEILSKG